MRKKSLEKSPKIDEIKLKIELVPKTSWYNNLRKVMPQEEWDKIRKKSYKDADYKCTICGSEGKLNCHEVWNYNDETHVQKLEGFIALCDMCHHVKHIGLAGILDLQGKLDYEKVIEHFMKVNKCDKRTFEEHRKRAFEEWRERSKHGWQVDLGEYKDVVRCSAAVSLNINRKERQERKAIKSNEPVLTRYELGVRLIFNACATALSLKPLLSM